MSIVDELIFGLVLLRQNRFLFFPGEQIFLSLCGGEGRTVSQGGRVLNYHHLHHYGHYCQAVSHLWAAPHVCFCSYFFVQGDTENNNLTLRTYL